MFLHEARTSVPWDNKHVLFKCNVAICLRKKKSSFLCSSLFNLRLLLLLQGFTFFTNLLYFYSRLVIIRLKKVKSDINLVLYAPFDFSFVIFALEGALVISINNYLAAVNIYLQTLLVAVFIFLINYWRIEIITYQISIGYRHIECLSMVLSCS